MRYTLDVIKVPEKLNQNFPGDPEGAKLLRWDESRIPSTTTGNPLPLRMPEQAVVTARDELCQ